MAQRRDRDGAALCFAPFDRQIHFGAAGIASDQAEFQTDHLFKQLRHVVAACADTGGAAARRVFGVSDVIECLMRRVRPHE